MIHGTDNHIQPTHTTLNEPNQHCKNIPKETLSALSHEGISTTQNFEKQCTEGLENSENEDHLSLSDLNLNEKRSVYKQNKFKRKEKQKLLEKENTVVNQKEIGKPGDNVQVRQVLGSNRAFGNNLEEDQRRLSNTGNNLDESPKKSHPNIEFSDKAAHSLYSEANLLGHGSIDFQNTQSISIYQNRDTQDDYNSKTKRNKRKNLSISFPKSNENNNDNGENNNNIISIEAVRTVSSPTNALLVNNNISLPVEEDPITVVGETTPPSISELSELQSRLYLKRQTAYFFATTSVSGLLMLMSNSYISFQWVLAAICLYWVYTIVERLRSRKIMQQRQSGHWLGIEDLFTAADAGCGIITLSLFAMKLMGVTPSSSLFPIPMLATSWVYFFKSKAPTSLKKQRSLIKSFYTLQIFLISLKLDNIIPSGWEVVFLGCWAYAGIVAICFALNTLFLSLVALIMIFRSRQIRICKEELIGLVWNSLSYGRALSDFLIIGAIASAYGSAQNFEYLRMGACINLVLSIMGILYAWRTFDDLVKYLRVQITKNLTEAEEQEAQELCETIKHTATICIQKKETYFVKVSSTYYLPLDLSFSFKNAQSIKRVKNLIASLKLNRGQMSQSKAKIGNDKNHKIISIEMLRKAKESLENKMSKFSNKGESDRNQKRVLMTVRDFNVYTEMAEEQKEAPRGHISADNIDYIKEEDVSKQNTSNEESQCYLCYDQKDNAVLMDCGHGGICYECAIAVAKSKNECMECRAPIKAVHKINPNPKFLDIVKGYEMCKVVIKTEICSEK